MFDGSIAQIGHVFWQTHVKRGQVSDLLDRWGANRRSICDVVQMK